MLESAAIDLAYSARGRADAPLFAERMPKVVREKEKSCAPSTSPPEADPQPQDEPQLIERGDNRRKIDLYK